MILPPRSLSLRPPPAMRLLPLVLCTLALPALPQNLRRVRVAAPAAEALATALQAQGYDVVAQSPRALELVVGPEEFDHLTERGLDLEVLEVGRPFSEIQAERGARAQAEGGGTPPGYPTLAGVIAAMNQAEASFPAICQVVDLTTTYGAPQTFEGRDIFAVKISDNVAQDEDEPNVLLVDNHHAREIVTPVLGLDAIDRLTMQYGVDATITQVVDDNEIWIIPVFNPDGYQTVFDIDNLWRKNRHVFPQGIGVDLNRNYPFGWSAPCGGSSSVGSSTYKGPGPASEAETQTMILFSAARRWAKVQDNHSFGREVRYGYGCLSHPWFGFMQSEASSLSLASGYGGSIQQSCCMGGEFAYQIATYGAYAFLWETAVEFQPSFATAQAEANLVWPGTLQLLTRPIPIWGHVTDACSGLPLAASITFQNVTFTNGEQHGSGGPFGRYQASPPPGTYNLRFSAPGYVDQVHTVTVASLSSSVQLEVALLPQAAPVSVYCTAKANSQGCLPQIAFNGSPSTSSPAPFDISATNVLNQRNGLLFYGYGTQPGTPFQGGTLCVVPPLRRTPIQNAGGSAPPVTDCSGAFLFDFRAQIQGGSDPFLVAGQQVGAQYWSRDPQHPDGTGAGITDGVQFVICN